MFTSRPVARTCQLPLFPGRSNSRGAAVPPLVQVHKIACLSACVGLGADPLWQRVIRQRKSELKPTSSIPHLSGNSYQSLSENMRQGWGGEGRRVEKSEVKGASDRNGFGFATSWNIGHCAKTGSYWYITWRMERIFFILVGLAPYSSSGKASTFSNFLGVFRTLRIGSWLGLIDYGNHADVPDVDWFLEVVCLIDRVGQLKAFAYYRHILLIVFQSTFPTAKRDVSLLLVQLTGSTGREQFDLR